MIKVSPPIPSHQDPEVAGGCGRASDQVNSTPATIMKAAIMVLFDGGARAEEFLNLRVKDRKV
jgi:hypothetical protein